MKFEILFKLKNVIYSKKKIINQVMMKFVYFEGVRAKVQKLNFKFISIAVVAISTVLFTACPGPKGPNTGSGDRAATVNGKVIGMEEVERAIKGQYQGQEAKMAPLELANVRLSALQTLIQQEVMYQKAEKEQTVPTDAEVATEFNKLKTNSGSSVEEFDKGMKEAGETEESAKQKIKVRLAVEKLIEKIGSKVEPLKDSEIQAFYEGNKESFVKKKGVKLAMIVIDPTKTSDQDTTVDEPSAVQQGNEIMRKLQSGGDFAAIARESSEDPQSKLQGGDIGYVSEEELKQGFSPQLASIFMSEKLQVGQIFPTPLQGKFFIFKLQERSDKDEVLTLESPGMRQQTTETLINARKQLLNASYAAIAMNEAKVENFLAKRVVENPNELSGARPAPTEAANTNSTNTNAIASNANTNVNAAKKDAKAEPKKDEAKNTNVAPNTNASPAANANAKQ
jgi:peptidyl-prolyl cis-trans isomerase SurA